MGRVNTDMDVTVSALLNHRVPSVRDSHATALLDALLVWLLTLHV